MTSTSATAPALAYLTRRRAGLLAELAEVDAALASVRSAPIDPADKDLLKPSPPPLSLAELAAGLPSTLPVRDVVRAVAAHYGVRPGDLAGRKRTARLSEARAIVAQLCRRGGHSFAEIGRALGGRDHSTVLVAARRGTEFMEAAAR